jgi:hypothetical protein
MFFLLQTTYLFDPILLRLNFTPVFLLLEIVLLDTGDTHPKADLGHTQVISMQTLHTLRKWVYPQNRLYSSLRDY